ncbi:MAG: carboxypeptidase regulatory-like domain-containing protein [Gemmatimonadales bacterium]
MRKTIGVIAGLMAATLMAGSAAAQTGRIVGRVIDGETGQPVAGAIITVVGVQLRAQSGVDGRYVLADVPAGPQSIRIAFIGYTAKTVSGVAVPDGGSVQQDLSLTHSVVEIAELKVTAELEKGSVAAALDEQRSAVGVTNTTTAEQIDKSPDSDAAQAVQRVSGDGERTASTSSCAIGRACYTTTSLNGARVPSPGTEKKVVLARFLFPSGLLDAITVSKTFTPDLSGDFSGAEVNLRTRSFPAERIFKASLSTGFNSAVTGKSVVGAPTAGNEWLALAASNRALPTALTSLTDFTKLTSSDINSLIRQLPNDWSFRETNGAPNVSGGVSLGGESPILGQRIGYVGSFSYSRSQEQHTDEVRARAVPADAAGTPKPYNEFVGSTGMSSVLWGGLLNLSTWVGQSTKLELNNTYNRTADNNAHLDWGTLEEFQQVDSVRRTSLQYIERTVRSNQIKAEHQISDHHRVNWSLTSSGVSRQEPDRADLAYGYEFAATGERLPLAWLGFIPEAAKRTASDLTENALNGSLAYTLTVGRRDAPTTIQFGGAYRRTTRDAQTASYNLRAIGLGPAQRVGTPEELFNGPYTEGSNTKITIEPNTAGGSYNAVDKVTAGYAMAEVPLSSSIRVVGGARVEQWDLDMQADPVAAALVNITRKNTDVLYSLAVNTSLTDAQTLRISASQTLARPEYRELAPISYRDMLGEREVFGDSSLVRTLVQNFDARWEWYPSFGELVSVALFAKHFDRPIEQVDVATSGVSQLSFINAESAFNYGVEIEIRKGLGFLAQSLQPFGFFSNVTLMKSRISTSNSQLSALTNDNRPMVGQAPYVVNTGLTYSSLGGTSATLLFNVVGKRISSAAVTPLKVDTYERPRPRLDFSVRLPVTGSLDAKLDATNLLNSAYEERQGDVVRYRYLTGRGVGVGFSWSLR